MCDIRCVTLKCFALMYGSLTETTMEFQSLKSRFLILQLGYLTQGKNIQTAYEQVPRFALMGETGEQLFCGIISACQKQLDMPHKLSLHKILLLSSLPEEKNGNYLQSWYVLTKFTGNMNKANKLHLPVPSVPSVHSFRVQIFSYQSVWIDQTNRMSVTAKEWHKTCAVKNRKSSDGRDG